MFKDLTDRLVAFSRKASTQWILLVLIIFFAAALRFYRLGMWSFWGDEVFSIGLKEDGFNYNIWRRSLGTGLIQLAVSWLGVSEWSARLMPAIVGVVSIPALYVPVRKGFGTTTALLFSSLLAVSTWHLYWSQNARFYTLLLLFYSLAILCFYLSLEQDRPGLMLLSLILIGLAARESLVAVFFFLITPLYWLLLKVLPFERPPGLRPRNLLIFFTPALLLGGFFVGPYLANWQGWRLNFGRINTTPLWIFAGTVYYIGLPMAVLGVFGAGYLLTQKNRATLLFALGAVIPLAAITAVSLFHYAATRYVFVSLTCWILLAALAVRALQEALSGEAKILAFGVLALLLIAPLSENYLYYFLQHGNRADWRAAFAYIETQKKDGDLVVTSSPDVGNYYLGTSTRLYPDLDSPLFQERQADIWFVEDQVVAGLYPDQLAWVKRHATLVADFDVQASLRNFKMRVYQYHVDD